MLPVPVIRNIYPRDDGEVEPSRRPGLVVEVMEINPRHIDNIMTLSRGF